MVVIERVADEGVRIGAYTLQVLAVHADEVVIALSGPDDDCGHCGQRPAERRCCAVCRSEVVICPVCAGSWRCPRCASPLAAP
jgi:hypothetical protein